MHKEYKDRYLGALDNLGLARALYEIMASKPLLAPHGHVDPAMLDANKNFTNPVELLVTPDHYVTRMLASQGISYESLGIPRADGSRNEVDPREVWTILAANWHLFRSTPSRIWIQEILATLFDVEEVLNSDNAALIYQVIDTKLQTADFKPQALFKRFNIEVLATTDATCDSLSHHQALAKLNLGGLVIPTFRPDDVSDPARPNWKSDLKLLATTSGIEINSFANLLEALTIRRSYFKKHGATATDHGVYSARTLNLGAGEKEALFNQVLAGSATPAQLDDFRAVMLFEHALMAADDGLVMQIHPGALRNYDSQIF